VADEDALLGVPGNQNDGPDADDVLFFLEGLHDYFTAIRDFLLVVQEDFFPKDLRYEEPFGFVGELGFVIICRPLGEQGEDALEYRLGVEFLQGRNREYLCLRQQGLPLGYQCLQTFLGGEVNLVDNQQYRDAGGRNSFGECWVSAWSFPDFGNVQKEVCIRQGGFHKSQHGVLQFVLRLQETGGVRNDHLVVIPAEDAQNTVPGSLGLGGDDGDFLAHQDVHQG